MTEQELDALEEQMTGKLAAIKTVRELLNGNNPERPERPAQANHAHNVISVVPRAKKTGAPRAVRGELVEIVKSTIAELPENTFSSQELFEKLREHKKPSIKAVLVRMEKAGTLKTIEKGAGRKPTKFAKV